MVANLKDRAEIERFLRDASSHDLLAERGHLQELMASVTTTAPESLLIQLAARIAYELRFRVPLSI